MIDETVMPNGFSRADGLGADVRPGTATPSGSVIIRGSSDADSEETTALEEYPESPEIERGEQATITHRMRTGWTDALTRIESLYRGVLQEDQFGNLSAILSAKITHRKGGMADLDVVSEGRFDPPPDEFEVNPVELGVNIMKHPRYFYALQGSTPDEGILNQMVIRKLQDYFENTTSTQRDSIAFQIWASLTFPGTVVGGYATSDGATSATDYNGDVVPVETITGTDMAKRAALEIISKYWRGTETPYIVGIEISWSSYYFLPIEMNLGGYVEDPVLDAVPQLPTEFISTVEPADPNYNIFSFIAEWNPQSYSESGLIDGDLSISWLRKADRLQKNRLVYKITRTWWGSPVGFWDEELYTRNDRPQIADDFLTITPAQNAPLPALPTA